MGSLHTVTQLRPFVLSGDGAFLPILTGAEDQFAALFEQQMSTKDSLSRVPATIQQVHGCLSICGMNTTHRQHKVDANGKFLHIESGGKRGYDTDLSDLIEAASPYLDDFWFFVLWNNQFADEFSKSNGTLTISKNQKLPTNDYHKYITERLRDDHGPLEYQYMLESGLWAKRWYEVELAEYGPADCELIVEEFPDAINMLTKSLEIFPDASEAIAAIEWYKQHLKKPDR